MKEHFQLYVITNGTHTLSISLCSRSNFAHVCHLDMHMQRMICMTSQAGKIIFDNPFFSCFFIMVNLVNQFINYKYELCAMSATKIKAVKKFVLLF